MRDSQKVLPLLCLGMREDACMCVWKMREGRENCLTAEYFEVKKQLRPNQYKEEEFNW